MLFRSFSRSINSTLLGYRGALIIQEGKKLSETKVMPPKAQAKQVIMISENEKIKFFACVKNEGLHTYQIC